VEHVVRGGVEILKLGLAKWRGRIRGNFVFSDAKYSLMFGRGSKKEARTLGASEAMGLWFDGSRRMRMRAGRES
jgi:hypothetical protein